MTKRKNSAIISTETNETNQPEKLTLSNLYALDKKNDETETKILGDGKLTITINKVFRHTQIQKMIIDTTVAFNTIRQSKVTMEDIADNFFISSMLIFKYFTDLPIRHLKMDKKTDVAKLIAIGKILLDNDIFKEVLESFPPEELAKVEKIIKESVTLKDQMNEVFLSAYQNELNNEQENSESEELLDGSDGLHESGEISEGNTEES